MFNIPHLEIVWFVAVVALLTGYAILDGFDLGVGMLHLFSRKDEERRLMLNSIGPVWDGNEVWLVTGGGAIFAGFPGVYATLASGFYDLIMLLLTGIIFRAVAIEFRSKQPMAWWRWSWDVLFSLASLVIAFGLGLVLGNLINGIPLGADQEFAGTTADFFNPYAMLIGVFAVSLFVMHGAIYVLMKTEGELHDHLRTWINPAIIFFIMCYAIATTITLIYQPHMAEAIKERPVFFLIALINMFAIANIPREIHRGKDGFAFASSCVNIVCLMALYAVGTFPNLVRSSDSPAELSLTIYNTSSSPATLEILFLMAIIGLPIVLAYTFSIYWIFHGKVRLDATSY